MLCLCGSKRVFAVCCEPYLNGKHYPKTAETLMRSRYTAYASARIDYIEKTMCGEALVGFNAAEALSWSKSLTWVSLDVLSVAKGRAKDSEGSVVFVVYFVNPDGSPGMIAEESRFLKKQGRWLYVGGVSTT